MTSSAARRPAITFLRLGTVATGLVQMIQQALILPACMSSNIATVPPPGPVRSVPGGISHNASMKARSLSTSTDRWPGKPGPM
jgi:hypothetical protein